MKIPLTQPYWGKNEERAAVAAIRNSTGTGDGKYNKKLVRVLQNLTGSKFVYPVTSCTHGLELAMAACGIQPGDEVIMPSFTMTSTANCVALRGGIPVFADIDPKLFNIDPADIARKITKRTKGIILVHYGGMPCALEKILTIARSRKLFVVEDAAHAIGAYYKGKMLGTYGDIGVYSFHGTKNISCGEGGAVLTNRKDLAGSMEIYRANGTNRNAYLRGDVDKYSWVDLGSSYFLSDILASIILAQLDQMKSINSKRNRIAAYYTKACAPYASVMRLPSVPQDTLPNWHIYPVLFDTQDHASRFMAYMRKNGIEVSMHYVPLHTAPMGRTMMNLQISKSTNLQMNHKDLPVTEDISPRLVRLPIYPGLTKRELRHIVTSAHTILKRMS